MTSIEQRSQLATACVFSPPQRPPARLALARAAVAITLMRVNVLVSGELAAASETPSLLCPLSPPLVSVNNKRQRPDRRRWTLTKLPPAVKGLVSFCY